MRFEACILLLIAPDLPIESNAFEEELMMSRRLFRLMMAHQKIDEVLDRERRYRVPDPFAILRLKKLKLRTKDLIHRFARTPRRVG